MKKIVLLLTLWCLSMSLTSAQTILYIPVDDRPVNLDYVIDTARAAGLDIMTPPPEFLGGRDKAGEADALWQWLLEHAPQADDAVLSADSLLYGSLVASRTHTISMDVIQHRLSNFTKLKECNPDMRLYLFSTVMRTPQNSECDEEPAYYEKYGTDIFRISALRDKDEIRGLSQQEKLELAQLLKKAPKEILEDWQARRNKNFTANQRLIDYAKKDYFAYFLLGRDDCSPFSQSHMESRRLGKETADLPAYRYSSFPGADELGMLLIARAVNQALVQLPIVKIEYAPGTGPDTVPSYEDTPVGRTIQYHVSAAGGIALNAKKPDLVLAVNTPFDGVTRESDNILNKSWNRASAAELVNKIAQDMADGQRIAAADIAFANGADNAFLSALQKRNMLFALTSYAGWNTASNTIGCAIGQGLLADRMSPTDKNRLLAVRFLDDWAYQANIREEIGDKVLQPLGGSWFRLGRLTDKINEETERRLRAFAAAQFPAYPLTQFSLSFPWNRMFEVHVMLSDMKK